MASLELLSALNTGANTVTTTVASARGITQEESARQLSVITARGLVIWADDRNQFTEVDADRRFAGLSTSGLMELHRLQDAAAGR